MKYNHKSIEQKWQKRWEASNAFAASEDSKKQKSYLLVEFPYPSGEGLHAGHVRSYTAMDVLARKRRAEGQAVLYPIGWDAFGLPTENYAIKTGTPPAEVTKRNTDTFRRQLKSLGLSFDWSREINTTDPAYYRWTQWLFLQFYKKGLAYKATTTINWCPKDKIGLANEEVVDGCCERCGTPVEKREKEQWMLAITKYAQRLYDDLDTVNYIERAKVQQRNWIGPSEGAELSFPLTWKVPTMDVALASNNHGKRARLQTLLTAAGLPITLKTPEELGVKDFDVAETGITLEENAEKKARALAEKTDLMVLADDTGFFIDTVAIDPVTVKRNALAGIDEKTLSVEDIAIRMQTYYADIATKKGGSVAAEWRSALCAVTPEKYALHAQAVRPVTLTNVSHGAVDPYLPLRGLYKSNVTGKYALEQTPEEELQELAPITDALKKLFTPAITVFTTRPDTVFGATYLALAPEHPFISACIQRGALENTKEVADYVAKVKTKTEIERGAQGKEKTGVLLMGVAAINPATKETIPVYVADYVLGGYGTGALMAVPAHDERDYAFAKQFSLPIVRVIEPKFVANTQQDEAALKEGLPLVKRNAVAVIVRNPKDDTYLCISWKTMLMHGLVTGGIDEGEDIIEAAKREVREETGYTHLKLVRDTGVAVNTFFYHRVKKQNRWAHFHYLIFDLEDDTRVAVDEKEAAIHEVVWKKKDELEAFFSVFEGEFTVKLLDNPDYIHTGEGILAHSAHFDGKDSEEVKKEITAWVGGSWVTRFKLRDWVFSRQRYWGEPIPMIHCESCGWQAVPEHDLPVLLPQVANYQPTDTGESPLANIAEWVNVQCPKCSGPARRETDVMPNWAGSSWYYLRYCDPTNQEAFAAMNTLSYWTPVDWYNGGMEHTVLHLLYSRFWHKFLFDEGLVPTLEPYAKRTSHGLILSGDGSKMSKSKGNVVNPDDLVEQVGADSLRLYEMFMGPFDQAIAWNTDGVVGMRRFLERVSTMSGKVGAGIVDSETEALLHHTIQKVSQDIEVLKMNTAVSALMVLSNRLDTLERIPLEAFSIFLRLLAPFTPHLTAELWEGVKIPGDVSTDPWPVADTTKIVTTRGAIAVQVNGKIRGTIEINGEESEEAVLAIARANPAVAKWLTQGKEAKAFYVPGKIVSFVVVS